MSDVAKKEPVGDAAEIVASSRILTDGDLATFAALTPEFIENRKKAQVFRTRTEMEVSVLNDVKHPTPDAKYWQAVREQQVMFDQTVLLSYEYRTLVVETRKLQRRAEETSDPDDRELLAIEAEKNSYLLREMERVARDRIRELREWSDIKRALEPHMTSSTDQVDDHQLVSLTRRYVRQALSTPANISQAEKQNLDGLLRTALARCVARNKLDEALAPFNREARRALQDRIPYAPALSQKL